MLLIVVKVTATFSGIYNCNLKMGESSLSSSLVKILSKLDSGNGENNNF
jgi:hypothetical protein